MSYISFSIWRFPREIQNDGNRVTCRPKVTTTTAVLLSHNVKLWIDRKGRHGLVGGWGWGWKYGRIRRIAVVRFWWHYSYNETSPVRASSPLSRTKLPYSYSLRAPSRTTRLHHILRIIFIVTRNLRHHGSVSVIALVVEKLIIMGNMEMCNIVWWLCMTNFICIPGT